MVIDKIINILLIEDEDYDVQRVRRTLEPFRDRLIIRRVVSDGQSALNVLQKERSKFDVVIMDYQIVGGITGETLIRRIKDLDKTIQIIVITKMTVNITDFEFANQLLEAGAMWYCTKYPGDIEDYIYQPTDFILSIMNAFEKRQLERAKRKTDKKLQQNIQNILENKTIIGNSEAVSKLKKQITRISGQDANVMIYGASGTGKELVATHVHYQSPRKYEKFIPINCGSLPHELIESELFGFEKGAFTGASLQKPGLFEIANNGTLFLDEIAELPMTAQVKLLRVLQDGELDKIGRTDKVKVNVRVIAATNQDLSLLIKENKFREDLFYRLNVVTVNVPALEERNEDIPLLVNFFLNKFTTEMNIGHSIEIQDEALQFLRKYEWPGNIRQLQNVVQRLLLNVDETVTVHDVRIALGLSDSSNAKPSGLLRDFWDDSDIRTWREMEKNIKYEYFIFVRQSTASDAEAARQLGLAPPNYYRMCKELGIK